MDKKCEEVNAKGSFYLLESMDLTSVLKTMNSKNTFGGLTLALVLTACASDPIDPLDPTVGEKSNLQPQCPIGYEPVYSTEIVIKSTDDDKKSGKAQQTYRCEPIK